MEKTVKQKLDDLITIFNDPAGVPVDATENEEEFIDELADTQIIAEEIGGEFTIQTDWKIRKIEEMWDKYQDYLPS